MFNNEILHEYVLIKTFLHCHKTGWYLYMKLTIIQEIHYIKK